MFEVKNKPDDTLYLTVNSDNHISYATEKSLPVHTSYSIDDFFNAELLTENTKLKIPAKYENIPIILKSFFHKCRGAISSLKVCSPRIIETCADDPDSELHEAKKQCLNPSIGGWHEFDERDYPSYRIAFELAEALPDYEDVKETLKLHPVWSALSFLDSLDSLSLAHLISWIIDPRWFINETNPNDFQFIYAEIGLTKTNCSRIANKKIPNHNHSLEYESYWRCRNVVDCWAGPSSLPESQSTSKFLWQKFKAYPDKVEGLLNATKLFVDLFIHIWLDVLACPYQRGQIFIPEQFIQCQETLALFKKHINNKTQ